MRIVYIVKWITAYNCGKPKWHTFTYSLDIVSQNVPYHNYATKIADLGIIFLRRSNIIHWYQLLHAHNVETMPFRFYGPPCTGYSTRPRSHTHINPSRKTVHVRKAIFAKWRERWLWIVGCAGSVPGNYMVYVGVTGSTFQISTSLKKCSWYTFQ